MHTLQQQHRKYERRLAVWLGVAYVVIAVMALTLVVYSAWSVGWRPGRW